MSNQSFGDNRIELPMRYLAHAGMKIEVNPSFYLQPHLIATYQNEAMDILAGGHLSFRLGDGDSFFQVGALYRYGDSFIPFLGFETGGMILGFSYDANVGELSGNSENFSVFEISLLYVFAKKSYTNKYVCPRL